MSAETPNLREAWSSLPTPEDMGVGLGRFTGERIERILAIVGAIGSIALGMQALFGAMTALKQPGGAHLILMLLVFGPLLWMVTACICGRGVRQASGAFAIAYALAVPLWSAVVDGTRNASSDQPWIFFLVDIGVIAAILAFSARLQFVWAFGLPLIYGYARLVEGDFTHRYWITTGFDVSFTIILGTVLVSLAWMFRQVAAGVDDAREKAVAAYAAAAAVSASEEERIAMGALMHDSVLAALIAAERASSDRERTLAVGMAREALTRLANAEASIACEGNERPVVRARVVSELRRTLSEQGVDAVVEERGAPTEIPGRVAHAMVLAARQAIGNALMHAAGRGLHIVVESKTPRGVTLSVLDAGPGFDPEDIGEDRLGIRASIVARMAAIAGSSRIISDEHGTTVELSWEPS